MTQTLDIKNGRVLTHDGRRLTPREVLNETIDLMKASPELYSQSATGAACGTPACIAGFATIIIHGGERINQRPNFEALSDFLDPHETSRDDLAPGWVWLFNWEWSGTSRRYSLYSDYLHAKDGFERVTAGVAAIRLFMRGLPRGTRKKA